MNVEVSAQRKKERKKSEKTDAAVSVVVGVTKRRVEWEGEKTRKGQRRSRELEQQHYRCVGAYRYVWYAGRCGAARSGRGRPRIYSMYV